MDRFTIYHIYILFKEEVWVDMFKVNISLKVEVWVDIFKVNISVKLLHTESILMELIPYNL